MAWLRLEYLKLGLACGLLCGTLLFASISVLLSTWATSHHRRRARGRRLLTGMSCMGGGVFLATCFLHLIPEATEQLDAALHNAHVHVHLPLSHALIVVGFLVVLISEQLIHTCTKSCGADENVHAGGAYGHSHGSPSNDEDITAGPAAVPNYGAIVRAELDGQAAPANLEDGPCEVRVAGSVPDSDEEDDRMTTISTHDDPGSHSAFRAIILVFALSVHSVFEGLAIGLRPTAQQVMQLFGAIVMHKFVIAVTLGASLVSTSTRLSRCAIFSCLTVFSAMAPLGMLVALGLEHSSPMVIGVLGCITAGTFVYLTFFEILPHELNSKRMEGSRLYNIYMLLLGVAAVVCLMLLFPDHD